MPRILAALTLACYLLLTSASASVSSIQPLKSPVNGRVFCTAFSINEEKGYWATAMHCAQAENGALQMPLIGDSGEEVKMVAMFPDVDMIVLVSSMHAETLPLAKMQPSKGEVVSVTGFGWGLTPATTFWGKMTNIVSIEGRDFAVFDMHVWPGHSGSPVQNALGEVVSVTQVSIDGIAGGSTWDDLSRRLSKYWGA